MRANYSFLLREIYLVKMDYIIFFYILSSIYQVFSLCNFFMSLSMIEEQYTFFSKLYKKGSFYILAVFIKFNIFFQ